MATSIELARWRRSQIAETFASVRVSALCYRAAKDIFFVAIVEPELKLREVELARWFDSIDPPSSQVAETPPSTI
jgi:hypothetical protein